MDKLFFDMGGEVDEFISDKDKPKHVRFPVKLAVKHEKGFPEFYSDFVLNVGKGGVFIKTDSPIPKGSFVVMHFYIPPEQKLLGEFRGKVIDVNRNNYSYPRGMYVKFLGSFKDDMKRFVAYLEEKQHLIDFEV